MQGILVTYINQIHGKYWIHKEDQETRTEHSHVSFQKPKCNLLVIIKHVSFFFKITFKWLIKLYTNV